MKKLLFLFDTDPYASVFDTVVAYDGGADRVTGYANVTPDNVGALVDGTIFTRGGKDKQKTAIFVGGGDMAKGEALLKAVQKKLLRPLPRLGDARFRTAPTPRPPPAWRCSPRRRSSKARRPWCLPAPARSACAPRPASRRKAPMSLSPRAPRSKCEQAAQAIEARFGVKVKPVQGADDAAARQGVEGRQIVFAAGAIGLQLLPASHWEDNPNIEAVADVNAQPPLGIEGIEATDKGKQRDGKICFGALGIGGLKLKLHRACIGKLFESSEGVLDAEEIYALAKEMA